MDNTMEKSPLCELVEHMIQPMVSQKELFSVAEVTPEHVRVEVAPDDIGRIIGKQGRTIRAVRTMVAAAGYEKARVEVDEATPEEE